MFRVSKFALWYGCTSGVSFSAKKVRGILLGFSFSAEKVPGILFHLASKGLLTLLIPCYFRPTHYIKGGYLNPPTISLTFSCTKVKFCRILEIPFKVLESQRSVENLLYDYHGNCSITWFFSLIIVKMFMKNR